MWCCECRLCTIRDLCHPPRFKWPGLAHFRGGFPAIASLSPWQRDHPMMGLFNFHTTSTSIHLRFFSEYSASRSWSIQHGIWRYEKFELTKGLIPGETSTSSQHLQEDFPHRAGWNPMSQDQRQWIFTIGIPTLSGNCKYLICDSIPVFAQLGNTCTC